MDKMKRLNKKSNVPIILFVLGVFAVCGFALLTFFISDFSFSNSFVGIGVMQGLSLEHEEYIYYLDNGVLEDKAQSYFNVQEDVHGKYLFAERNQTRLNPSLSTNWKKKELLFSAKYYLP